MLTRIIARVVGQNSVLKAVRTYQGSKVQQRYHEFDANPAKVAELKSDIDYETVNKQSQGCIMIREFLFQESKPELQINFSSKYLVPIGKWSIEELDKLLEEEGNEQKTPTQIENELIMREMDGNLKQKLNKFYQNMGKDNYTFSVKEEVMKISEMKPRDFDKMIDTLQLASRNS